MANEDEIAVAAAQPTTLHERVAYQSALEADRAVRAVEPPTFRPGDPVWRAGWLSCQQQVAQMARDLIACGYSGGGLEVLLDWMLAMRPTPPTLPAPEGWADGENVR